ncbi:hypothetical protein AAFF_G00024000 [Aldrovandia affinis]|uniref:Ubiquitin-like-conjugating enzyme ATG10 n=1 Tax=Aldrovandia affinis TaxID=143900 RepID=A0AAD7T6R9_9TELE|nr:hypothetical protein AAFF_G00024000 [Aldrovandia affinis]
MHADEPHAGGHRGACWKKAELVMRAPSRQLRDPLSNDKLQLNPDSDSARLTGFVKFHKFMAGERAQGMGVFHLEEETFRHSCRQFICHSRALDDGWSWEEVEGSDEGYMKKSILGVGRTAPPPALDWCSRPGEDMDTRPWTEQVLEDEDEDEEQVGGDKETSSVIRYEYHVLYSCSYQTPVLYFRASTLDGRSLSLEKMWDNVHPNYRQRLLQGPWDTITQQEHPLIGQPFFVLHPCRTQEFMRPVLAAASAENRSLNYIVSWLSSVGPVVGLSVPLSYASVALQATEAPK